MFKVNIIGRISSTQLRRGSWEKGPGTTTAVADVDNFLRLYYYYFYYYYSTVAASPRRLTLVRSAQNGRLQTHCFAVVESGVYPYYIIQL